MKQVLQYVPSYNYGGIESFTYQVNKELSKDCKFYYLVEVDIDSETKKKLSALGAEIIRIPNMTKESLFGNIFGINHLFKKYHFDAVHVHDCNNRFYVMFRAKLAGVPRRIYHVHSKAIGGGMLSRTMKKIGIWLNRKFATKCVVCSEESGRMKGIHDYELINNCISVNDYRFNNDARAVMRKKYKIRQNDIVLLFVGRIEKIKNVDYLLRIMKSIPSSQKDKYVLIIVGDGGELNRLKAVARNLKQCRIVWAGRQDSLADYYSASDYFCLPSFAEGFPITLLEAQANGMSALVSVNVPNVVNLNGRVLFLKIGDEGIDEWVNALLRENKVSENERLEGVKLIEKLHYDSRSAARRIGEMYGVSK